MDIAIVTQLAQLGATAILLVILFFLWQEFKQQNQFIRDLLTKSDAERQVIAKNLGIDPADFDAQLKTLVEQRRKAKLN